MATYKNANYLPQSSSDCFDQDQGPGVAAPFAALYRCTGCHREIGIAAGHTLPPQSNHAHTSAQAPFDGV